MSWDTLRKKSGKQPWDWLEFEVNRCIHSYGNSPCTAVLGTTGAHKCYNSWATCQDPTNFSAESYFIRICMPSSQIPRIFSFVKDKNIPQFIPGLMNWNPVDKGMQSMVPILQKIDHSPSMPDPGKSLGLRVKFTAKLMDAPHHDIGIDKYVEERAFDPMRQGSFMRKLKARWPHYIGRKLRWYQGYMHDSSFEELDRVRNQGMALSGGSNTLGLALSASSQNDAYNGMVLRLLSGAGAIQERNVLDYNGATKVATVAERWATNMLSYSSKFNRAYWASSSAVITENGAWWTVLDDNAAAWELLAKNSIPILTSTVYIASIRVKKTVALGYYPLLRLAFQGGTPANCGVAIDTNTGAVINKDTSVIGDVGIVDDGDAWIMWVRGNSGNNNLLHIQAYPAVGPTPIASGYNSATVGALDMTDIQIEQASDLAEYVEADEFPVTLPNASTGYEVVTPTLYESGRSSMSDFRMREFVMEKIEGPDSKGNVSIIAKDVLKLLDDERVQVPIKSKGSLMVALDAVTSYTQIDVTTSDQTEYDLKAGESEDYIRIDQEVLTYTGKTNIANGVRLTGVTRAAPAPYTSTKAAHEIGDIVQRCRYLQGTIPEVVEELMVDYGGIDSSFIPTADWTLEGDTWLANDTIKRLITEPEGVKTVIDEIIKQTLVWAFWFDEVDQQIRFRGVHPPDIDEAIVAIDDTKNIVKDSVVVKDDPDAVINEIQILYAQIDPVRSQSEIENYRKGMVVVDSDSQSPNEIGQRRIRRMFCRWHPGTNEAVLLRFAERTLAAQRRNLMTVEFQLERKDENVRTAEFADLTTLYLIDSLGLPVRTRVQILRTDTVGERLKYKAKEDYFGAALFGRWAPGSLSGLLYDSATADQQGKYIFWADSLGQLGAANDPGKTWS